MEVPYLLGNRNSKPKARVSIVRWNLKEAGCQRMKGPLVGKVSSDEQKSYTRLHKWDEPAIQGKDQYYPGTYAVDAVAA